MLPIGGEQPIMACTFLFIFHDFTLYNFPYTCACGNKVAENPECGKPTSRKPGYGKPACRKPTPGKPVLRQILSSAKKPTKRRELRNLRRFEHDKSIFIKLGEVVENLHTKNPRTENPYTGNRPLQPPGWWL